MGLSLEEQFPRPILVLTNILCFILNLTESTFYVLLPKILMLGKTEGRRRGRQRMRWLDGISDLMNMSLSKLREIVKDREAWHAAVHGIAESNRTWPVNNNQKPGLSGLENLPPGKSSPK